MKLAKPLLLACVITIGATLLLSLLPYLSSGGAQHAREIAVFHAEPINRLTNSNMVDALVAAKLHERLHHVEWRGGVLAVTIRVGPEGGPPSGWFADIAKLVRLSFEQLGNVKRLLVRIAEEQPAGSVRLLAAADVRKTDSWLQRDMELLERADPVHDEQWRERLRVSFTAAWEERFGQVSGFTARPAVPGEESR